MDFAKNNFPIGFSHSASLPLRNEYEIISQMPEAGTVARLTGVGGRDSRRSLHGCIHGVLSSESPYLHKAYCFGKLFTTISYRAGRFVVYSCTGYSNPERPVEKTPEFPRPGHRVGCFGAAIKQIRLNGPRLDSFHPDNRELESTTT